MAPGMQTSNTRPTRASFAECGTWGGGSEARASALVQPASVRDDADAHRYHDRAIAHNSYDERFVPEDKRDREFEGSFEANVNHERFGLLCYLIERADFWRLAPKYSVQLSDCFWNVITVEGESATRSVLDYCYRGPVDLVAFEHTFHSIDRGLHWTRGSTQGAAP
jgi:hypothetical protein